ncbi:Uncharacterised protein [uncultured archaeon]|nr:Uncharacterised protein [uncultured archaeon]
MGNSPSQASNSVANMVQAQITEFDKNFIDNLKGGTPHLRCMTIREQSEHAGINHALFMYQLAVPSGSTNPPGQGYVPQQVADGTIQNPISLTVNQQNSQLGEYGDFATVSAFGQFAALDDATLNTGKELSFRCALGVNDLAQATADTLNNTDSTVLTQITSGSVLDLGTLRGNKQELEFRSCQPVRGGKGCGVICPLVLGDLWNGTTVNNSAVDFWKYTEGGQDKFDDMAGSQQDNPIELPGTNIVFYQSPYVTQQANLNTHGIAYRSYVYMKDAVVAIFARVPGDVNVDDGDYRSIKVELIRNLKGSAFDPLATIGNIAGYRYHVAFSIPPDTTMRSRQLDSVSAFS